MARARLLCYNSPMRLNLPPARQITGMLVLLVLAGVLTVQLQTASAGIRPEPIPGGTGLECKPLCLLQPIGGVRCLDPCRNPTPLGIFFTYFNLFYRWLVGVAMGVTLLMVVVGGIQIIQAGDQKSQGMERIRWAVVGLLILIFSSMILQTLNPAFYR